LHYRRNPTNSNIFPPILIMKEGVGLLLEQAGAVFLELAG
jgi:hypothetical protein